MWFDARAKLAEIAGQPPATFAAAVPTVSQLSHRPKANKPALRVAEVASVATPPPEEPETFPHGVSVTGSPKTWTGRIVSLDDWRNLSEWEKHGSKGMLWCGNRKQWVPHDR